MKITLNGGFSGKLITEDKHSALDYQIQVKSGNLFFKAKYKALSETNVSNFLQELFKKNYIEEVRLNFSDKTVIVNVFSETQNIGSKTLSFSVGNTITDEMKAFLQTF